MNESYDLLVLLGDYAYDIDDDFGVRGDEYFIWVEPILSKSPVILVPGNHENYSNVEMFNNRFKMPGTTSPAENNMFIVEVNTTRFIGMNLDYVGMYPSLEDFYIKLIQDTFSDLNGNENSDSKFTVFFAHKPFYCLQRYEYCEQTVNKFAKIEKAIYEVNINVNLWGHVHRYERLDYLYKDEIIQDKNKFSLVIGTGGNKESIPPEENKTMTDFVRFISDDKGYVVMQFFNNKLTASFYSVNLNEFIDEHSILSRSISSLDKKTNSTIIYLVLVLLTITAAFIIGLLIYTRSQKNKTRISSQDVYTSLSSNQL